MSKFEVGNRVKIIDAGTKATIAETTSGHEPYALQYGGDEVGDRVWYDNELELVESVVDVVKHPKHYSSGLPEGVQVIDIINAQDANFNHGNVIKYILRWKFKNGLEDLKKAQVYLGWLIEQEEAKNV